MFEKSCEQVDEEKVEKLKRAGITKEKLGEKLKEPGITKEQVKKLKEAGLTDEQKDKLKKWGKDKKAIEEDMPTKEGEY